MKWAFSSLFWGAALALVPMFVEAQSVTPPQLDPATLRARLAHTMDPPGRAMPSDAANLDALLSQKSDLVLRQRLQAANKASDIVLDMNWEQEKVYDGANWLVSYAYMIDAWRLGSAMNSPEGEELKQTAAMFFLYTLAVAIVDGPKCSDASAPGHRVDQLLNNNRQIAQYLIGLPRADRMALGSMAIGIEAATASVRSDDEVLCGGGAVQIAHDVAAQGDKPLQEVPNASGAVGKSYEVPSAPGYKLGFVSAEQWRPKQIQARQGLPATTDSPAYACQRSHGPGSCQVRHERVAKRASQAGTYCQDGLT